MCTDPTEQNFLEIVLVCQLWCCQCHFCAISATSGSYMTVLNAKFWRINKTLNYFWALTAYISSKVINQWEREFIDFFYSKTGKNMELTHVASLTQKVQLEASCQLIKSYIFWNNFQRRIHRRAPLDATIIISGKNGV